MMNVIIDAITPAEKIVLIGADNIKFETWKFESSVALNELGISTDLHTEAKLYSPHMLKIVTKYERLYNKRRRDFNFIEHEQVRKEFDKLYLNIKTGKLDYMSAILN